LKINLKDEMQVDTILDIILNIFSSHGEKIKTVDTTKPTLEDVFIHAAGEAWH